MGFSRTVLDLKDSSRTKIVALALALTLMTIAGLALALALYMPIVLEPLLESSTEMKLGQDF